jgi:hypothetical protein
MRRRLRAGAIGSVAAMVIAASASAGTVTPITLGDFASASVLDFNSAPLGNISGTASLFTSFGIASVAVSANGIGDSFGIRPNASRALWANSGGLAIVDPGAGDLAADGVGMVYTLVFAGLHSKFGIGVHDQGTLFTVAFFDGLTAVGSAVFDSTVDANDLSMAYFANTDAFDRITITAAGGYAIDNITIEGSAAAVPAPASLALLGLGLAGLAATRRRNPRA